MYHGWTRKCLRLLANIPSGSQDTESTQWRTSSNNILVELAGALHDRVQDVDWRPGHCSWEYRKVGTVKDVARWRPSYWTRW